MIPEDLRVIFLMRNQVYQAEGSVKIDEVWTVKHIA